MAKKIKTINIGPFKRLDLSPFKWLFASLLAAVTGVIVTASINPEVGFLFIMIAGIFGTVYWIKVYLIFWRSMSKK